MHHHQKKILTVSLLILTSVTECFSQSFESSKDYEIYAFRKEDYGVIQTYEYMAHWLTLVPVTTKLDDTVYIKNVLDFIQSQNALVKKVNLDTAIKKSVSDFFVQKGFDMNLYNPYTSIDVRLNDTMDAFVYLNMFLYSGLFDAVDHIWVSRTNDNVQDEK